MQPLFNTYQALMYSTTPNNGLFFHSTYPSKKKGRHFSDQPALGTSQCTPSAQDDTFSNAEGEWKRGVETRSSPRLNATGGGKLTRVHFVRVLFDRCLASEQLFAFLFSVSSARLDLGGPPR
jgi:hypothetical protein